jgi:hypothetical protein
VLLRRVVAGGDRFEVLAREFPRLVDCRQPVTFMNNSVVLQGG